ncbi:MAG: DUF86 domain-containing protein [Bacteroidota bacterium]
MHIRTDKHHVIDIYFSCKKILSYTNGLSYDDFQNNDVIIDAVIRNIEIIGEATKNISQELKQKYPDIYWTEMAKTRDKLIHHYFGTDIDALWDIVSKDIPYLTNKIYNLIQEENWTDEMT